MLKFFINCRVLLYTFVDLSSFYEAFKLRHRFIWGYPVARPGTGLRLVWFQWHTASLYDGTSRIRIPSFEKLSRSMVIAGTCRRRWESVLVHVTLSLISSRKIIWHAFGGVGFSLVVFFFFFLDVSLRMLRGTSQY